MIKKTMFLLAALVLVTALPALAKHKKAFASDPSVTVVLTSAQIETPNSPVTVIPAQGPGTLILVDSVLSVLQFKTTPYTDSDFELPPVFVLSYAGTSDFIQTPNGAPFIPEPLVTASAATYNWANGLSVNGDGAANNLAADENESVQISTASSYVGGDSTLELIVSYHVVTP